MSTLATVAALAPPFTLVAAPPAVPADLLEALRAAWDASTLPAAFGQDAAAADVRVRNKYLHGTYKGAVALPYVRVAEVTSTFTYTTGKSFLESTTVQFDIFGRTQVEARNLAVAVRDHYVRNDLAFADGSVIAAHPSDVRRIPEPDEARGVARVWRYMVQFDYLLSRSLA
jgi:hypothetical protein